jgi:hypothetical protein
LHFIFLTSFLTLSSIPHLRLQSGLSFFSDVAISKHHEQNNPLTPNDIKTSRSEPIKIKIPSKKSRQAALRGGI